MGKIVEQVWALICTLFSLIEKLSHQCALKKWQDPEVWLSELEDYRMKLEELGSSISDNQFMIHILINMTSD